MKKIPVLFFLLILVSALSAQTDANIKYRKTSVMIPMRDGVKLYTVILTPVDIKEELPILIQRTPYGANSGLPEDNNTFSPTSGFAYYNMSQDGYIFVFQDIRGKYKSEGHMQIHQPLIHLKQKGAIDESTDTWDTIDWLIKNIPNNNGKAGIVGISYPGWLALVGSVDPHPH